jgi:hypothetical protein
LVEQKSSIRTKFGRSKVVDSDKVWSNKKSPVRAKLDTSKRFPEVKLIRKKVGLAADFFFSARREPGANPKNASYNASVVKIYSAVNSMARF